MKAFLDSSVLVAAFYGEHPHHGRSADLISCLKRNIACTAAHCLIETYAVATRMPGRLRASPEHALQFLGSARERLSMVALSEDEYVDVLDEAVSAGVAGGAVYDAVIAHCALKSKAQAIYTWNARHFTVLGSEVASRVREP